MEQYFHLPTEKACQKLGLGLTILKRICRRLGIARWPYKKQNKTIEKPIISQFVSDHSHSNSQQSCDFQIEAVQDNYQQKNQQEPQHKSSSTAYYGLNPSSDRLNALLLALDQQCSDSIECVVTKNLSAASSLHGQTNNQEYTPAHCYATAVAPPHSIANVLNRNASIPSGLSDSYLKSPHFLQHCPQNTTYTTMPAALASMHAVNQPTVNTESQYTASLSTCYREGDIRQLPNQILEYNTDRYRLQTLQRPATVRHLGTPPPSMDPYLSTAALSSLSLIASDGNSLNNPGNNTARLGSHESKIARFQAILHTLQDWLSIHLKGGHDGDVAVHGGERNAAACATSMDEINAMKHKANGLSNDEQQQVYSLFVMILKELDR